MVTPARTIVDGRVVREAWSLAVLLDQVNSHAPHRSKRSDGWIGDPAHRVRRSDHNPNSRGVVCARDFTHDPGNNMDCGELVDHIRTSSLAGQEPRVHYIIYDRLIYNPGIADHWRSYTGANPHESHAHISVYQVPLLYDDRMRWGLWSDPPRDEDEDMLRKGDEGPEVFAAQELVRDWMDAYEMSGSTLEWSPLKLDGEMGDVTFGRISYICERARPATKPINAIHPSHLDIVVSETHRRRQMAHSFKPHPVE